VLGGRISILYTDVMFIVRQDPDARLTQVPKTSLEVVAVIARMYANKAGM
jgi:hypothetical protein